MRTINRREAISLGVCSASASLIGAVTGAEANSGPEIDTRVHSTLRDFYWRVGGAQELLAKSAAVLVFPFVIKAGMGLAGNTVRGHCSFTAGLSSTITPFRLRLAFSSVRRRDRSSLSS